MNATDDPGGDDAKSKFGLHLRDCLRYFDDKTQERYGKPLLAGLVTFPADECDIVSFASNAPGEREVFAQAMINLLIRWGYIEQ
jgi:hypothetical protein